MTSTSPPDLILHRGLVVTLDRTNPAANAVAIKDGKFVAVGSDKDVTALAGPATRLIDLKGRRVLPGLIDNHTHVVRGGLNYNMELRWDGVRSLADAMSMLKRQVAITPPPQWVRVVGGFTEHRFAEKRLPTLDEINAVAPDTPVFILHLYDRALLNGAALRAAGYTRDTPDPPGGEIERDANNNPTGLLLAKPNRIAALGGGIAVQHRMAYQGEYFVERYGPGAAEATPPVARMLQKGLKVSAGTDATRVASYNPWVSLAWLVTGRTVGGLRLYPQHNCLDRDTALRMWTENVTWFSNEESKKGRIEVGQLADLIVPDRDYFSCAEAEIAGIASDLTMVGGRIVYGAGDFAHLDEGGPPPAMPDRSPVRAFGGYAAWADAGSAGSQAIQRRAAASCGCGHACGVHGHSHATAWSARLPIADLKSFWARLAAHAGPSSRQLKRSSHRLPAADLPCATSWRMPAG